MRDISRIKHWGNYMEDKRRIENNAFELEYSPEGIIVINQDGRFWYVNERNITDNLLHHSVSSKSNSERMNNG